MSLLYMDSFDHYLTADYPQKHQGIAIASNTSIVAGAGARGSAGLVYTGSINQVMNYRSHTTANDTIFIGFRFKTPATYTVQSNILAIIDALAVQYQYIIGINTNGTIYGTRPTVGVDGTSTYAFPNNVYTYLEIMIKVAASPNGIVKVRAAGVEILSITGINTKHSSNPGWSIPEIYGVGNPTSIDDLYVCDGAGPAPYNTFLGDCKAEVRSVTGPATYANWTPSTGANWQNIDDATPNGDTDRNISTIVGDIDTFTVQPAALLGAQFLGVQMNMSAKKVGSGACGVSFLTKNGGTISDATTFGLDTAYRYVTQAFQGKLTDSTLPWDEAYFDSTEFGYIRET